MPLSNTGIDRFLTQNYYSKSQLNAGQLDTRYFAESEFVATSAGAGDAGKPVKLNGSGTLDATLYTSSVVTLTGTQTLTNKTLTSATLNGATNLGLSNWVLTTLTSNPVINFDANDYFYYDRTANSLSAIINSFTPIVVTQGAVAVTGALTLGGVNVVTTTDAQTLTNKTITAPVISTISNSGTITLPSGTSDTLVGRATTDTLTNKTLTSATLNGTTNLGLTNWYLSLVSSTDPLINFDANDYIQYGRAGNTLSTVIGSSTITAISASGLAVTGALTLGGVAVDTISGANTLTNKTITDPLISRIYGSSSANGDLTLEGTSSATKTSSSIYLQPTGGTVGVGFSADPGQPFAVRRNNSAIYIAPYDSSVDQGVIFAYNPVTPGDIPMVIQGSYVRLISLSGSRYQMFGTFTPTATADATGNEGDVAFDANYMYRKTAAGWKRAALSTF